MRYRAVSTTLFVTLCVLGCAASPSFDEGRASGGNGGSSSGKGSGGTSDKGGNVTSAGGDRTSGGSTASGGADSSGGSGSAGDTSTGGGGASGGSNAGGSPAKGGAGGAGSGGAVSTASCTDTPPDSTPCSKWKEWNQCSISYLTDGHYCEQTCGRCSGSPSAGGGSSNAGGASNKGGAGAAGSGGGGTSSTGGSSSGGGATGPGSTNPPITGSNGYATRYWDCCKPSCSWTTSVLSCQKDGTTHITDRNAKSGCEGGPAYECYDFAPFYDAGTNMSYGFVAHNGVACGTCYMFQFTGEGNSGPNAGATAIKGQQMVVQTVNIGGLGGNQFDLLIPGGGVGDFAAGCQSQWGGTGAQTVYGGMLSDCKGDCSCMKGKCSSFFGNNPTLKAGCDWFTNWFSCADNPKLIYKQVSCPSQLTSKSGM